MGKFHAIINNTTGAPGNIIDETNDLRFDLIEGTEAEIHAQAQEKGNTRVHLYEHSTDDYDMDVYKYVTTQAVSS